MPQPIALAMPAIAIADERAPAHLQRAAEALEGLFTTSPHEAAFIDGLLAEAMLDLEYGPETERAIYLASCAPGIAGFQGPIADAWAALSASLGPRRTAEDICAFLCRHFGEHGDRVRIYCDEAALKHDFADLGVSTGYIGNCEQWGDDRTFKVLTKVAPCIRGDRTGAFGMPGTGRSSADTLSMHIMDVPREFRRFERGQQRRYFNGPVPFNAPEVRAWLEALRAEVTAGRAYIYGQARAAA